MNRLVLVGVLGLVTACGSTTTSRDGPTQGPLPSATVEVSCGDVALDQGELLEVVGSAERACLEAALRADRGATLTVTAPTVEGDPIVTTWNLAADGTLVADIDSSRDRFGGEPRMTRVSCGRVTALPNPLSCAQSR